MGEEPPEVWADELRRNGRVVFPVRRRTTAAWGGLLFVVFGVNHADSLTGNLGDDGAGRIFALLGLAVLLSLLGIVGWQLITQRPVVIVDHEGLRVGRRTFMAWKDVGTIGIPTGPKFFMNVPVLPQNVWAKDVRVPQANVKDIPAFATWLTDLLAQHRANEQTRGRTPDSE
jgi:hypothetical protein